MEIGVLTISTVSSALTSRDRTRVFVTIAAIAVALCEGAVILRRLHQPPMTASAPAAATAPARTSERSALDVEHVGRSLRLRWDGNAEAVRDATHATLYIQ